MAVRLVQVDVSNWEAAISLHVLDSQKDFVAPNLYSIAESQFFGTWECFLAVADDVETPVGFLMWGLDEEPPEGAVQTGPSEWWIIRFMIDAKRQGAGYGTALLDVAIDALQQRGATSVFLSFEPENDRARALYERRGFVDTGRVEDGEIVYRLEL